ncbi:MAG: STAS domain-containing protein [Burkholderiales bacterium]|nr:STAS domain-containing protein [Burkholderiales bacterium]
MQLSGELTFGNAHTLWESHSPSARGKTTIDVSAVTTVDSAGLALITALKRRAGPQCRVVGLTSKLAALAAAYDIESLF